MTKPLPFRPRSWVGGLRLAELSDHEKADIKKAVARSKPTDAALTKLYAGIELAIAAYREEAEVAKHLTKAGATKKLKQIEAETVRLIETLRGLDEPTRWLILSLRFPKGFSLSRMPFALADLLCAVRAAANEVEDWPSGRRPDYARNLLGYGTARALRDAGITLTLTRRGTYARALIAVMQSVGLNVKFGAEQRDVMALMKQGLKILKSETPPAGTTTENGVVIVPEITID